MARKSNGHLLNKLKLSKRNLTAVNHAAMQAKEKFDQAKDSLSSTERAVKKYAKINPWKAMGMSVLAGVVVGRLFKFLK